MINATRNRNIRNMHVRTDDTTTSADMDVVTVTGGSGFLGQHIVKTLQERANYVSEIRVLDVVPFIKSLDFEENKPITAYKGSITDREKVTEALTGVSSVIHVAGLVSFGTFPDTIAMENINVKGTENIIKGCLECGVERLIFCSTVDVVIGHDPIHNGDETTVMPRSFLFPGYPETKYKAECLVLDASGRTCKNGKPLKTAVLRANVMYGELDPYYITNGLKSAYKTNGILYQIGNGSAKFQQTYVGNSAWAFICADKALRENRINGGEIFFIPDDTPIQNTFQFMNNFLSCRNFRLSKFKIPFSIVYYPVVFLECVLHILSSTVKVNLPVVSCSVKYICMDLYFSGRKARALLGYTPIYTPTQSIAKCLPYYTNIPLK